MRSTILILLWSITSLFSGYANNCLDEEKNGTNIIMENGEADNTDKHARIPAYVPITCHYIQGNIYVTTLTDLGEIQISITCLETGSFWESINDSSLGTICVPASSANGNYMVRIVTENNDSYFGYYNL